MRHTLRASVGRRVPVDKHTLGAGRDTRRPFPAFMWAPLCGDIPPPRRIPLSLAAGVVLEIDWIHKPIRRVFEGFPEYFCFFIFLHFS